MRPLHSKIAVNRRHLGLGLPIRVLLVEDDADAATLTSSQVNDNQDDIFLVELKGNLLNALSRLGKPGIDVVLLDLGMPESAGYETHRAITSMVGRAVPVVILTADDTTVSQDITKLQGAASYLVKCRTSSAELRRALIEAVVPAMSSKVPLGWWVSDI